MQISDFFSHIYYSWPSLVGYSVMTGVLLETVVIAGFAERDIFRAHQLQRWLLAKTRIFQADGRNPDHIKTRVHSFVAERLIPTRHRLAMAEATAAYLSLGMTLLTYAIAVPGAREALQTNPDALLTSLGMGSGVSCLGIAGALLAHVTGKRLDRIVDRIEARLDTPSDTPPEPGSTTGPADRPDPDYILTAA